ncbi:hypothetical protein ACOJQI_19060 [Bacillus salacetis]|uniref:hypothetical protein n=1 Tax=Bacillus salacetis TaxID=2315464 RepID=UPI003BA0CEEB
MDDKIFEKRMNLLNKNYERMPGQTDVSEVIKAIEKERKPEKQKRKMIHWPYAASFIGVLLISSVLALQFTGDQGGNPQNGEQSELTVEEVTKTVEEIESHYKVRRTQAIGSLGLSEEGFAQTEMGRDAEEFAAYVTRNMKEDDGRVANNSGYMESITENLDDILKTPQQMINGLTGKSIKDGEAEQWVKKYVETQKDLLPVYEAEMKQYRNEWQDDIKLGQLEGRDILLEREKQYSEELVKLVEGATANGISLMYSEKADRFVAGTDVTYVSFMLSSSELPEVYMDALKLKSIPSSLNGGVITTTWARAGGDLLLYERAIESLPEDSGFLEEFQLEYITLLRAYVKGSSAQSIFNEEGTLKADIKESYETLIQKYPDSKTAGRIEPYYNKLKENQFNKPEDWESFNMDYEL